MPRIDSNDEKPENCMLRPSLKMQAKKTAAMLAPDQPVFLTCKSLEDPSQSDVWFSRQRYKIWKRLNAGTVPANKEYAAGTSQMFVGAGWPGLWVLAF